MAGDQNILMVAIGSEIYLEDIKDCNRIINNKKNDELLITGATRYILYVITNLILQVGGNNYGFD